MMGLEVHLMWDRKFWRILSRFQRWFPPSHLCEESNNPGLLSLHRPHSSHSSAPNVDRNLLFKYMQVRGATSLLHCCFLTMHITVLFIFLIVSLAMAAKNCPPAEANSCRKIKFLSEFSFCPPCWEQHNKSYSYYRNRNLLTKGCCHRLYPEKVKGWKPIVLDGPYWKDHNWKGLNSINGKSSG
jgi:hypothetical protein